MKKVVVWVIVLTMVMGLVACGSQKEVSESSSESVEQGNTTEVVTEEFTVSMISDTAGINDQSFNQSAWEGLQEFNEATGANVNYLESKQSSDYVMNMERLGDNGADLIWAIGYDTADALNEVAQANLDLNYAIVDYAYEVTPDNVIGVVFRAEEPSFLVGYIAGRTTETNKVGFVGGIANTVIKQFQSGYEAGVAYAAKELGKDIEVSVQYAESFSDAAKGKGIAAKMFSENCDIVYQAAGGTGIGVIEAAKEANKFAIGVDRDQSYLAPENILTSALKKVGKAVQIISKQTMDGDDIGGNTIGFGLEEECVGIPENHENMSDEIYDDALQIAEEIKLGNIKPPSTEAEYNIFLETLK